MDLLVLPFILPLIIVANVVQQRGDPGARRLFHWLLLLFNLPAFAGGLFLLLAPPALLETAELPWSAPRAAGLVVMVTAIWGLATTLGEVRRWLARRLPLDPEAPVHTLALMLSGYLAALGLFPLTQGGLEALSANNETASLFQIVAGQLLFVVLALAGVGFLLRRGWLKTRDRLGLEWPTGEQLRRGLRWLPVLLLLEMIVNLLLVLTNPDQAELMDNLSNQLLADMDTAWEWLVLALAAGVGEEIFFRGALQPVLGIWFTSLLFAILHTQYGLSLATIFIFAIGVVFGLIRRRLNTTVAILLHAGYNFILGLLSLLAPMLEETAAHLWWW